MPYLKINRKAVVYDELLHTCREILGYDPSIETTVEIYIVWLRKPEDVSSLASRYGVREIA